MQRQVPRPMKGMSGIASPRKPRKPVKIGIKEGGGPAPGYRWTLLLLDEAYKEARTFLDEYQYNHIARQFRELAMQEDPTHSPTVDVRTVDPFFEVRDKGGILGKINVRVYFFVVPPSKTIVILGATKKEREGMMLPQIRITISRRRRMYLEQNPS